MELQLVTDLEKDVLLLQHLRAQQMDEYSHTINLERLNDMLQTLPEGAFRSRVESLKAQTEERLVETTAITEALKKQLPSEDRVSAAVAFITQQNQ